MAIHRENHKEKGNFTQISNVIIEDTRISGKAKSYLILMLSRPDTWKFNMNGLLHYIKEKESALESDLDELEKFGYLKRIKEHINGRIDYTYEIYENPAEKPQKKSENSEQKDKPESETPVKKQPSENLSAENQSTEKQEQKISPQKTALHSNTGCNHTENNNTDLKIMSEKSKCSEKQKFGKYKNVLLTPEEYNQLVETYGKDQTDKSIESMSGYRASNNKPHYPNTYIRLDLWIRQDIENAKQTHEKQKRNDYKIHYDDDFDVEKYKIFINDFTCI